MSNAKSKAPRWLVLLGLGVGGFFAVVAGLIVVAVLAGGNSPSDTALKECQAENEALRAKLAQLAAAREQSAAAPAPQAPPAPEGSFGNGTMVVGKDVKPGKYKSAGAEPGGPMPMCYHTRLKGFSGEMTDIISNEVVQPADGAVIVTIKPTDAGFQSKGCARWEPLE